MTRPAPLRLHMNENTAGCAPGVVQAVRALTARDLAQYPDYAEAEAACARQFGVDPRGVLLTNGLDDGLHAAANRARTYGAPRPGFEAIVIEPAFEMFALAAESADARVVRVTMDEGFAFPLARVLAALTPHTRLIFVNDPNNPTGVGVPAAAVEQIAAAAPEALVLLDEAWAKDKKILMLEPRRLAARAASSRMASTLGEKVGDTVGLRVRFGSKISKRTRIEVITEGVFTRLVLDDPSLDGISAVLFDDVLDDGQTQTKPLHLRALLKARPEILVEYAADFIARDTDTLVGHGDHDVHGLGASRDGDRGVLRRVLERVGQEIDEHLLDQVAVTVDAGEIRRNIHLHGHRMLAD